MYGYGQPDSEAEAQEEASWVAFVAKAEAGNADKEEDRLWHVDPTLTQVFPFRKSVSDAVTGSTE